MNDIHSLEHSMTTHSDTEIHDKRQAILLAANKLFTKQSYENTTIADIAKAANVAVGTVYLYFRNKHEIYINVSLDWKSRVAEVISNPAIAALPIGQVPRAMIEAAFRICRENMALMKLFDVNMQTGEEICEYNARVNEIINNLDDYFQYAITQGQLKPFATHMYAQILYSLVQATLRDCFALENGEREEEYRERLIEIVDRLFFGPSLQTGT
jgi:AcrR family transcriptional regulator